MPTIRVSINFSGRLTNSLGKTEDVKNLRRTIEVPPQFTYEDATEAARLSLYKSQDGVSYEHVRMHSVAFN